MKLDRRRMEQAVSQNIITPAQAEELWAFWQSQQHDIPHFTFIHVLYYLGGMIAIAAMTLFVTIGFMQFGSGFVAVVSAVYAAIAVGLAEYFQKKGMPIPSGICATLAVALVPLFVFTVQDMLGYWPSGTLYRDYHTWIDWRWLTMESATLLAGAAMFKRYRYPFLLMPVAFTLWYMSMDCADWLFDWLTSGSEQNDWPTLSLRYTVKSWVSVAFGLLMLLPAFKIGFRRLCLLAVPLRRAHLLGRADQHGFGQRIGQIYLFLHQHRHGAGRLHHPAACVHRIRCTGHDVLFGPLGTQRV